MVFIFSQVLFYFTVEIKNVFQSLQSYHPFAFVAHFGSILMMTSNDGHSFQSLIWQINTLTIKTLPQMNDLFSMFTTTPNDRCLKTLNSLTTQFCWKNKKPRISLSTLQNGNSLGCLDVLNSLFYFFSN